MNELIVRAFHATASASADSIARDGFRWSRNEYDWLGDGSYFWELGESRAWDWAEQQYFGDGCIIEVDIDLRDCLDLTQRPAFELLTDHADEVLTRLKASGLQSPLQNGKRHGLDRLVINSLVESLESAGEHIASVRGTFEEGSPAFPGSALMSQAHVQIAVRDPSVVSIVGIRKVEP